MFKKVFLILLYLLLVPLAAGSRENQYPSCTPVLWLEPVDISSRDLYYGPGGKENVPEAPFFFLKEDFGGTNPKFDVVDRNGVKWKVKLGVESRPEVAAARLVWAAGYFAQVNYLVPRLEVQNMPRRLKRGQQFVAADGSMDAARLKRAPIDSEKTGNWRWRSNPFSGTRELNGLRVMMALLNNLDLKDANNAVFHRETQDGGQDIYMVRDLGSCFSERAWPLKLKGNLESYRRVGFIREIGPNTVDFNMPIGPGSVDFFHVFWYGTRLGLRWITENIPKADAKWVGEILSRLSQAQIEDAFGAAGFSPEDVQGFTDEVLKRISELNAL